MLNIDTLIVIMLNAIMLIVVAPYEGRKTSMNAKAQYVLLSCSFQSSPARLYNENDSHFNTKRGILARRTAPLALSRL
jgi:hypothetical protein